VSKRPPSLRGPQRAASSPVSRAAIAAASVRQLVDLAEHVVEDPPRFRATAGHAELARDRTQVVQDATDLDQAIVQLVDGLGVLVAIVILQVVELEGPGRFVGHRACVATRGASSSATAWLTVVSTTRGLGAATRRGHRPRASSPRRGVTERSPGRGARSLQARSARHARRGRALRARAGSTCRRAQNATCGVVSQ
jgi:hypothetical protein